MGVRHAMVLSGFLASIGWPAFVLADEPAATDEMAKEFSAATLPLVKKYCLECHSTEEQEGELDLERFTRFDQTRNAPRVWQRVGEVLNNGEMPPKEARQPDDAERARLRRWVNEFLSTEATRRAGDPGRVVLRRLNNAEYTYTLRDLTGVASLEPAREFPVDGAAGEGFTNTGNALVMSPSLVTKYLDAAKQVAEHAVLLPDGFRFSAGTTSRDSTEEALSKIRDFYRGFSDPRSGGEKVNLQGIVFDTNQGGRLPLERYLNATIADRAALTSGAKTIEAVAADRGLSPKYLGILWQSLNAPEPSLLLVGLQARWRSAKVEDVPSLVAEVAAWQNGLWKFSSVGHIGKVNGPKAWMEPVNPLVSSREVRFKIPPSTVGNDPTLSLVATDAGDGNAHDFVVWRQPRLVAPGRPDLPLLDVRRVARELISRRERLFANTAKYLNAAAEVEASPGKVDVATLAGRAGIDPDGLRAWLDYLGIASLDVLKLNGHFTQQIPQAGEYAFIKGWGRGETPLLLANSSDQHVRIPGNMKPHGVAVHPSPTLRAAVGWLSPVSLTARVETSVTHAHPECGNGVTWILELRRGSNRRRLGAGNSAGGKEQKVGPIDGLTIQPGDLISLSIGPRDGNHSCDLTAVDLRITEVGEKGRTWDLATDVSSDILAANPHADRLGNPGVWHFYTEPDKATGETSPVIPAGSVLARWQASKNEEQKHRLADEAQRLLASSESAPKDGPDASLARQLRSLGGPLLGSILRTLVDGKATVESPRNEGPEAAWGLDPTLFGKHPNGQAIDPASLCVQAPSVLSFRLPAELAEGAELVTIGSLDPVTGANGSVQFDAVNGAPPQGSGLHPSRVDLTMANGTWTSNNQRTSYASPIIVNDGSESRKRIESALQEYRNLFPPALCYTKIVPVDEVVTLTLFYREDGHLARLMLDDAQKARLDRLWDELHFVSRDALTLVDAYLQLLEYASQDGDPKVFEPLRKPINDRADAFRRTLLEAEPRHLDALVEFAGRAYRRRLTAPEVTQFRQLYATLRAQEIPHDEAFRLTLARVLVAPAFLYRLEKPGPGSGQGPVSNDELASRLSYFLWSSQPDPELRALAESGQLNDPEILASQARRLLRDDKARRLATEFACHWLHIADFDQLDEKSERHFPSFMKLRGAMAEESIRFFTDLFQHDGSVLDILGADYTFLNGPLAEHYGIPLGSGNPEEWRRVDGLKKYGRAGILGQATTLAKQSGASRTSPTLRGNWISEVLLGERLPRPPKGVPQLPDDEAATAGLTVRQLVEKHASDAKCAGCHQRIDPLGFSLEAFDAIGRRREKDLGDRPIDTRAKALDGSQFEGLDGLKDYLLTARRDAFVKQFCRKLLGYALGRSTQISDEILLSEMQAVLKANNYRVGSAIDLIVRSRQFREIRGRDTAYTD